MFCGVFGEPARAIGRPAERTFPGAFSLGALRGEGGLGSRSDEVQFIRSHSVNDCLREAVRRGVAIPDAIRVYDPRTARANRPIDERRHGNIASYSIALRRDQDSRPRRAELTQGRHLPGPICDLASAAHALIDVPRHDLDAFAGRPRLDCGALRFRAKPLLIGRDPNVGDRELRVAGAAALHGVILPCFVSSHVPIGSIDVAPDLTVTGSGYALAAFTWRRNLRDQIWDDNGDSPTDEERLRVYRFLADEARFEAESMAPFLSSVTGEP